MSERYLCGPKPLHIRYVKQLENFEKSLAAKILMDRSIIPHVRIY